MDDELQRLQETIGWTFSNGALLESALTHPSLRPTHPEEAFTYERLEFLGDSVLQLVVADELYQKFPDQAEGFLSKTRSSLVSRVALAGYAKEIALSECLRTSNSLQSPDGKHRDALLEDSFEALIGAIHLDGGYAKARELLLGLIRPKLNEVAAAPDAGNPKGRLQEILQAISPRSPQYRILTQSGPPHQMHFEAGVYWSKEELGRGEGSSKQEAEAAAAEDALNGPRLQELQNRV